MTAAPSAATPRLDDRILEIGAGRTPDERATVTSDLYDVGCDHQFDIRDDWPFEAGSFDGVLAMHVLEHIRHDDLPHVFAEAARVLRPDGFFEFRVPVGGDADADPTHQSVWGWRTIDQYADDEVHWVATPGFEVEEKRLRAWMCNAMWPFSPLIRTGASLHPCEFWYEFPGATGELIIVLRAADE